MTDRTAYTAGLRALADLLDAHPEVPLPYHGTANVPLTVYMLGSSRGDFTAAVSALPGRRNKAVERETFRVSTALSGLHVEVVAYRKDVCEKRVIGTREITLSAAPEQVIPAREARVETVEDVEWVCAPLLSGSPR